MLQHWRGLLCIFLCSLLSTFVHGYLLFENTAIVRTLILGGSSVHVTTIYEVKALESGAELYEITLGQEERARTSWLEAAVKGTTQKLPIKDSRFDSFR
jgi:oligosaccharyltransferase complex subunit alpha (ribophorin I)